MFPDEIVVLPSGTELSYEAALGDLDRAIALLMNEGAEAEASDLTHVAELLEVFWLAASGAGNDPEQGPTLQERFHTTYPDGIEEGEA